MKHKHIVEIYENLIEQTKNKIEKGVANIYYPFGTKNIIIKDLRVTLKTVKSFERRRDFWIGGKKW